ncbi:MAG: hypothetical protein LBI48_08220 [Burkholderiaceae bacterium]|jgi:hypothetical protein|nr:hypothetical protein [Burkholderiaceae bacterium]
MSQTPAQPAGPHPSELETSVETMTAEVMSSLGLEQPESEVPLQELAALEQINSAQPLPDDELARQALEAGGTDGDPSMPE